ncbi:MAG: S8/S53 family peptidase [Caldilineaceae bacterium]
MLNRRTQSIARLVVSIVLALYVAGCVAPDLPTLTPTPQTPQDSEGQATTTRLPVCKSMPGETVVIGFEDEIRTVVATMAEEFGIDIVLEPYHGEIWVNDEEYQRRRLQQDEEYVKPFDAMFLITTDEKYSIRLIEALKERGIGASPNYETHLFGHSGGDSPFGKLPHNAPTPVPGTDPAREQFALQQVLDVEAPVGAPSGSSIVEPEVVTVGVFDTAPVIDGESDHAFRKLEEKIWSAPVSTVWYSTTAPTASDSSRDHGVFVSSLVQAFAPKANVHLYRVLKDSGEADTWLLATKVMKFLGENSPSRTTPVVLNFSLGLWCLEPPPEHWQEEETPFAMLDRLLTEAEEAGAVIVAAAGNDSNRFEDYVLGPAYPASAPFSISVGAAALSGSPTCYSHQAQVFAPGGDGIASATPPATPIPDSASTYCVPNHESCTSDDCEYGVLGLSADSPSHYAYWSGTSFASPIVSGLAARILATGEDPSLVKHRIHMCSPQNAAGEHVLGSIDGC